MSTRLWRRYGEQALALLEAIEQDAAQAEPILAGTPFLRCEFELMAEREMIVTLEDFLRRRSDLALVTRYGDLRRAAGLMDVCTILFGPEQAEQKFNDYFCAETKTDSGTTALHRASRPLARSLLESQDHGLRLEHISKTVGVEVHIDHLDLELQPGGFNMLLGRTLAGKTTLMRLMAGLDRPTSGRVLMDDRDVTKIPVQQRKVAMVYQQFINYPSMTVYGNIASPLRIAGLSKRDIDRRVREAAEMITSRRF